MLKQLSVFVENEIGTLSKVTGVLQENRINLRAIASLDTPEFGILRMVVDEPEEARRVLMDHHFVVKITEVVALSLDDEPGRLHEVLELIAVEGLQVNYIYSLVLRGDKKPLIILHMEDMEKAAEFLKNKGIEVID